MAIGIGIGIGRRVVWTFRDEANPPSYRAQTARAGESQKHSPKKTSSYHPSTLHQHQRPGSLFVEPHQFSGVFRRIRVPREKHHPREELVTSLHLHFATRLRAITLLKSPGTRRQERTPSISSSLTPEISDCDESVLAGLQEYQSS